MTYSELQRATMGKEFIRASDGKIITRTQFYFEASSETIQMALNGYEGKWRVVDKRHWYDGVYTDPSLN